VIKTQFNCHYMTLSVCWRCASDLLIEPAKLNPLIKGPNDNPKGKGVTREVETKEFIENVKVGDYVLCRTTAPLIKRCIQLVQRGTPANVKGREIGDTLVDLVNKIADEMGPLFKSGEDPETLMRFIEALNNYKMERVAVLEAANRDEAALRVNDECEGLLNFCTEARNVDSVVNHIRNVFADVDDDSKVVLFLTGHKAKGLQNPRVWFLRPDLSPHPMAKKTHEVDQEMHLRYVILTRAEREFYYVRKEKDER
jgi:DNA helicase-2/ATP-dependent DNA helicase PcrA